MKPSSWQPAPDNLGLHAHHIHVWRANIDHPPDTLALYQSLLSADETTRAARFMFDIHRHRFITARGILRQLLSRYLLLAAPQDITFQYSEHGKPSLTDMPSLQFNVSHSNEWAVYAFSLDQRVGIDIEQQKKSHDHLAIAERFFSPYENKQLQALPASQQFAYFFQLWACKEAFIKALGAGLSFPLTDFDIHLTETSAQLIRIQQDATSTHSWHLDPISVAEGYSSAIAVEGEIDNIIMSDLSC